LGTALYLLIGNFAWVNPLAIRRRLVGLLIWLAGFGLILVFADFAEKAIAGAAHAQESINYWIYFLVYLLISYPGFFVAMQQHARLHKGAAKPAVTPPTEAPPAEPT